MRHVQLHLRGLLAILALTFFVPLPAAADPSNLGITVGELLQIIEENRDKVLPVEIERGPNFVRVTLVRPPFAHSFFVHTRNTNSDVEASVADWVLVTRQQGLWPKGEEPDRVQNDGEIRLEFLSIVNPVWGRFIDRVSFETWSSDRLHEFEKNRTKLDERNGYRSIKKIGQFRATFLVGMGFGYLIDAYVDCPDWTELTKAEYEGFQKSGLCPELNG